MTFKFPIKHSVCKTYFEVNAAKVTSAQKLLTDFSTKQFSVPIAVAGNFNSVARTSDSSVQIDLSPSNRPMETNKEDATLCIRRLRRIGRFLPFLEAAAAALLLLSYSSFHIEVTPKNPGDFLRRAAAVLVRPGFVFLIGNAIILLLFAKSGQISSSSDSIAFDSISFEVPYPAPQVLEPTEEAAYADNALCGEIRSLPRSRSEKFELVRVREESKLRRAETLVSSARDRKAVSGDSEGDDDAEQFRRTIEEFIAKQQRFRREELLAVVPRSAE